MVDPQLKEQFVELRATGKSFASIAEQLGVSKTTLISWSKECQADIANLKQIHMEALRETYRMGVEHRMELFSKQLGGIEAELDKRSLEDIPTERLLNMAVKLGKELNVFVTPVTFQHRSDPFELDSDALATVTEWQA